MKILSIVLSVYILALVFLPILELGGKGTQTQSCASSCSIVLDGKNSPSNDNGCDDICNPFMSCCTCLGYSITENILSGEMPKTPNSVDTFYSQIIFSPFSHSIWHPPQLG